jgi:hypothetical protein
MYPLLGNSLMERSDYEGTIQSFEHARAQMRYYGGGLLLVVSLVAFLWVYCNVSKSITDSVKYQDGKFDNLDVPVRQRLREAFYAADRTKYAGEYLLKLVNSFDEEVYMGGPITECISGEFTFNCLLSCIQAFRQRLPIDWLRRQHDTMMR